MHYFYFDLFTFDLEIITFNSQILSKNSFVWPDLKGIQCQH